MFKVGKFQDYKRLKQELVKIAFANYGGPCVSRTMRRAVGLPPVGMQKVDSTCEKSRNKPH